ncbi:MAG TPA: DnaJ domain-containing protein [Micropepsaceae bacterium]|nr:DnaJ domain-containing protein [Micropepsaceae bacterium]
MPALLAGVVLLGLLLVLARGYTSANARSLAKGLRFSGGIILGLLTVALALTGRLAFAFLTAGAAWYLLVGSPPPWHQTAYGPYGPGRSQNGGTRSAPPQSNSMSRAEALKVLGLEEGASEADIRAAHRRLILQTHPDKGGTSYLAAKINEAKDVLLRR